MIKTIQSINILILILILKHPEATRNSSFTIPQASTKVLRQTTYHLYNEAP